MISLFSITPKKYFSVGFSANINNADNGCREWSVTGKSLCNKAFRITHGIVQTYAVYRDLLPIQPIYCPKYMIARYISVTAKESKFFWIHPMFRER